ncbi:GcrA family cell cycle regulator [Martelella sp. FLE1502]
MNIAVTWRDIPIPKKVAIIKSVYRSDEEETARTIAEKVSVAVGQSVSRNAIIGLYSRRKSELADAPLTGVKPVATGRTKKEAEKAPDTPIVAEGVKEIEVEPVVIIPPSEPPRMLHLTVLELDGNTCRFPTTGTGADMLSCGLETEGRTYCPYHSKIAYRPKTKPKEMIDRGEYVPQVAG